MKNVFYPYSYLYPFCRFRQRWMMHTFVNDIFNVMKDDNRSYHVILDKNPGLEELHRVNRFWIVFLLVLASLQISHNLRRCPDHQASHTLAGRYWYQNQSISTCRPYTASRFDHRSPLQPTYHWDWTPSWNLWCIGSLIRNHDWPMSSLVGH